MQALWQTMASSWPLAAPYPVLAESVGEAVLATLRRTGLLVRQPLRDGDLYPDTACLAGREVVYADGAWAVCTGEPCWCEPVELAVPELVGLDPRGLVEVLRRVLALGGPHELPRWNAPTLLGERRLGGARTAFVLVPRPACVDDDRLDRWLRESGTRPSVLLAPVRDAVPARHPPDVVWLALDGVVDLEAGTVDLSELALSDRWRGDDLLPLLWPRFALVLEPESGTWLYAGQPLPLDRNPSLVRLLELLAARPNRWVCRRDLVLGLFPDEITSKGRLLTDPVKLERRIRQLVSDLGKAFAAVDPRGLPENPIENLRARSDLEGGYRLALAPERVFSRPSGGA